MLAKLKSTALARPLAQGHFRALWLANIISNMGAMMQTVAAAWLMASLSGTAHMVALVQSASSLPGMALALLAGALADHLERRHVMLAAQGLMFLASTLLAWLTWTGHIAPWSLLLLTLLVGVGTALHLPAWQSSIRDYVPRDHVPDAISLNSIGFNVARTLGPALGGALMLVAGAAANFLINSLTYIVLILVLLQGRRAAMPATAYAAPARPILTASTLKRAIYEGLAYVWRTKLMRFATMRVTIFCFTAAAIWALMPLIARDALRGSQMSYGALLGAIGIGSIVGAFVMNPARHRMSVQKILGWSALLYGGATALSIAGFTLWAVMALMLMAGMGWVLTLATVNITIQMECDPAYLARVVAINNMGAFGGLALGSWVWGLMTDWAGLHISIGLAGLSTCATALLYLVFPLPSEAGRAHRLDA